LQVIIDYIIAHYFELIAALLGLVSIRLQIFQNSWYWAVSIVMVSMYIFVYIDNRLYADMSLQMFYLGISFYGWYNWLFGKRKKDDENLKPAFMKTKQLIFSMAIAVILFFLIAYILISYSDSDVPWWDAFTTSLSFVAVWMLAKKYMENWIFWIIVDAVSVGIYIYKGMYPTTVLFLVLTVLAFVGYNKWKKEVEVA
jgi:nicotinamide mononucleotide transporter